MRMWNVPPQYMCRKHLLGEHLEIHMFVSSIRLGKKMQGYIKNNLLETHNLKKRHDEIVNEMIKRKYNHKTPLDDPGFISEGNINVAVSSMILFSRCKDCRKRMELGI